MMVFYITKLNGTRKKKINKKKSIVRIIVKITKYNIWMCYDYDDDDDDDDV